MVGVLPFVGTSASGFGCLERETQLLMVSSRSYEPINRANLRRLLKLSMIRLDVFLREHPKYRVYRGRLISVALCQGAAQHALYGKRGVKDFDVWFLFSQHQSRPFYYRRRFATADFGPSKFGVRREDAEAGFTGRRIDLLGRSLPVPVRADPINTWVDYLEFGRTKSARHLRQKAVVMLRPQSLLGDVIWSE